MLDHRVGLARSISAQGWRSRMIWLQRPEASESRPKKMLCGLFAFNCLLTLSSNHPYICANIWVLQSYQPYNNTWEIQRQWLVFWPLFPLLIIFLSPNSHPNNLTISTYVRPRRKQCLIDCSYLSRHYFRWFTYPHGFEIHNIVVKGRHTIIGKFQAL